MSLNQYPLAENVLLTPGLSFFFSTSWSVHQFILFCLVKQNDRSIFPPGFNKVVGLLNINYINYLPIDLNIFHYRKACATDSINDSIYSFIVGK